MDFASLSAMLTSLKTATDIAKFIRDSDISIEKAESKLKLAELISALADVKIQFSEIQQILLEKENEIGNLKNQISIKENLIWEQPYYWLNTENKKDGPYCQQCYDKNKELIRLQGNGSGYWACKTCKSEYFDSTYRRRPTQVISRGYDPSRDD